MGLSADNAAFLAQCAARVDRINALEPALEALSDKELRGQTAALRAKLAAGATLDDVLEDAFAVPRRADARA